MASFACPQGHRWDAPASDTGTLLADPSACPICGTPSLPLTQAAPTPVPPSDLATCPPRNRFPNPDTMLTLDNLPQPTPAATTGVIVPGYEILGELGRGGMGVVYKARQQGLNRIVALKMILAGGYAGDAERSRFRAEGEAAARLRHPNIVQIYEIGAFEGRPFLSLEFCDGGSLADRLRDGPLAADSAAGLIEQLARGVHTAHRAGIIHRDLKPANILLQGLTAENEKQKRTGPTSHAMSSSPVDSAAALSAVNLHPRIADFGLAKQLDAIEGMTQSGAIMGTPSYMAPEQASGHSKDVGPAADIYALGAILYECLTRRPPYQGATSTDTMLQVLDGDLVPPRRLRPDLPSALEAICVKCLARDPDERYPSALVLADDLLAYLDGEPVLAERSGSLHALRVLLADSRHTEVLRRWGRIWLWHSPICFFVFLFTDVLRWQGVTALWPYVVLWTTGIVLYHVPIWLIRIRGSSLPLTLIERQMAQMTLLVLVLGILTAVAGVRMGLHPDQVVPLLVLELGLGSGAKAILLRGSFWPLTLLLCFLGLLMTFEPRLGATSLGVVGALGLSVPGLRSVRAERRQARSGA